MLTFDLPPRQVNAALPEALLAGFYPHELYIDEVKMIGGGAVSGESFGIIGQDPSVSKSNRLRVVFFRFLFTNFGSIDSSKMTGSFFPKS